VNADDIETEAQMLTMTKIMDRTIRAARDEGVPIVVFFTKMDKITRGAKAEVIRSALPGNEEAVRLSVELIEQLNQADVELMEKEMDKDG